MKILVIAEHDNNILKKSTLNTVTAATKISDDITVLVAGYNCTTVIELVSQVQNVKTILFADELEYSYQLAEDLAALICSVAKNYTHILAPATAQGKNLLPRVAALLDVAQISDIIAIESPDTFLRPIYAGNIITTVQSVDKIKVITVRSTAFPAADIISKPNKIEKIKIIATGTTNLSKFVKHSLTKSDRPELTAAHIVISGGRGMGNSNNFKMLEEIADKLGAAIGASRAAVDAGFAPNDYQVGQTGKVVAPDLYIAIGISGAIQHLAGMKDSRVIVAINKDEEAPIFQVADYGLVQDLFTAIPEISLELDKLKNTK